MPISKKQFEQGDFVVLRGKTLEILEFLKKNKDNAYTAKEIADNFKTKSVSINPALKRLVEKKLIEKKRPYYIYLGISDNKPKPVLPPKQNTRRKPLPKQLTPSGYNAKKLQLNPQIRGEEIDEDDDDFDNPE